MLASDFYLLCVSRQGNLPSLKTKQEKKRGQTVLKFFNAMASEAEKELLFDRSMDQGEKRRVAGELNDYIVDRLNLAFTQAELNVRDRLPFD